LNCINHRQRCIKMTLLDDADSVREDDVSIYEVEDMDGVMDEIGAAEYDDNGYLIQHTLIHDYDVLGQKTDEDKNKNNNDDVVRFFAKCCLLIIIIYILASFLLHL